MESIDDKRFLRAIIAVFIVVLVLFLLRFLSVKAVDYKVGLCFDQIPEEKRQQNGNDTFYLFIVNDRNNTAAKVTERNRNDED